MLMSDDSLDLDATAELAFNGGRKRCSRATESKDEMQFAT